eukprot:6473499-Pyramimonas_sp.AAC.1
MKGYGGRWGCARECAKGREGLCTCVPSQRSPSPASTAALRGIAWCVRRCVTLCKPLSDAERVLFIYSGCTLVCSVQS